MSAQPDAGTAEQRLGEVLAAYLEAIDAGWAPDRQAFLDRYPDLAPELESFFQNQDQVAQLADSLARLVSAEAVWFPSEAPTVPQADSTPSTDPHLESVRFFDDYEIVEEIARGGMGVVFKARQRGLSRFVALKMILAGQFASPVEVQRFLREAENASHLDHPNIVPIYTVGEVHGQRYFTMKLIEGGNLSRHLPRLSQDLKAGVRVLVTVAEAVYYGHQRGILHRDLKPANILLDHKGQPHVTDFGLAKRIPLHGETNPSGMANEAAYVAPEQIARRDGELTTAEDGPGQGATLSVVAGTPSYMPPEQAAPHKGGLTTAADVYSLGAILYKLLTGHPPFRAATWQETLEWVREREPVPPRKLKPAVPRDLEAICLKCLEKRPERRYASAQALAGDLERWLNGEPVRARPRSVPARIWRTVYRNAILCIFMAVAGFAVGTPFVYWFLTDPERPLKAELRQLDRGETVTLIGETGAPVWWSWAQGEDAVMVSPSRDKPFSYTTLVIGRLQLLTRAPASGYRFAAEVRHDDAINNGEVGVYFASTSQGRDSYWCELTFADRGILSEIPPAPWRKGSAGIALRLVCQPGRDDGSPPIQQAGIPQVAETFAPEFDRWRSLVLEVRADRIHAWWDGKDIGEIAAADLSKFDFGVPNSPDPPSTFPFDPAGGLGLYVYRGMASFRNVRVEPLP